MFGIVLGYFRDAGVYDGQRGVNGLGKGILGRGDRKKGFLFGMDCVVIMRSAGMLMILVVDGWRQM